MPKLKAKVLQLVHSQQAVETILETEGPLPMVQQERMPRTHQAGSQQRRMLEVRQERVQKVQKEQQPGRCFQREVMMNPQMQLPVPKVRQEQTPRAQQELGLKVQQPERCCQPAKQEVHSVQALREIDLRCSLQTELEVAVCQGVHCCLLVGMMPGPEAQLPSSLEAVMPVKKVKLHLLRPSRPEDYSQGPATRSARPSPRKS